MFDIKGIRNANRIMASLRNYVDSVYVGENAYFLNKRGVELVGADYQYRHSDQVTHKIMRSDAYIYFKPTEWYPEREFIKPVNIQPDAFFYSGSSYKFLEVDNTQKWTVNKRKFNDYKRLKESGAFQRKYGKFPPLIWVVKMHSRKERLLSLAKEYGISCEVYLHEEVML